MLESITPAAYGLIGELRTSGDNFEHLGALMYIRLRHLSKQFTKVGGRVLGSGLGKALHDTWLEIDHPPDNEANSY